MGALASHQVSDADFVAAIGVQWQHRPLAPEPGLAALLAARPTASFKRFRVSLVLAVPVLTSLTVTPTAA